MFEPCHLKNCRAIFFLFALTGPLHAHTRTEHGIMTKVATVLYNRCTENVFLPHMQRLSEKNISEDTNLWEKWLHYNHFYSAKKPLVREPLMRWRKNSQQRILLLQYFIKREIMRRQRRFATAVNYLGQALHHIQDMTSPSHVVPVMHSFFDGFESYQINLQTLLVELQTLAVCGQITRPQSLIDLHHQTALNTEKKIASPLSYQKRGHAHRDSWGLFWQSANTNEFGSYGVFGNNFGEVTIHAMDTTVTMKKEKYDQFKKQQMIAATLASIQALHWFYSTWKEKDKPVEKVIDGI